MATLLHSESRRLYSWWWDSHNSPKNSKWLQENLTDMDAKVKAMIKLIEEDADSFARRAEMYYKKRPELMKLVEEFYRAYRALAERYDHATVDLRQAHRDLAQAFPNQLPPEISDDSSFETEPHTPDMLHPGRALFDPDESYLDVIGLSSSNLISFEKNESVSDEFDSGMKKRGLKQFNEMFGTEQSLHGGLAQLSNVNQNLKIQVRSETERASKAECDVQALRKTLDDMQSDREAVLIQYQQSLEKISSLENKIVLSEDHAQMLNERTNIAETEVIRLRQAVDNSNEEKEDVALRYKDCLETITKLENEICCAQEDLKQLKDEISVRTTKLRSSEERVGMLEKNNQYLQSEVDNLVEKMLMKDQQLLEKDEEMGNLQSLMQDENSKLKEICKKEQYVNEAISEKLKTMEKLLEKNAALENSLLDVSGELESSKEKIKSLQDSFQVVQGEKFTSVDEKNKLFSHLEVLNEKIQKLWEKNTSLQNSFASANIELAGSREKSKCLEEICELLRNEKSNLLAEKGALVLQLKNIEGMQEKLEEKFTELKENNMSLENEKKYMIHQVEELQVSLSVEKDEHTEFTKTSESRLTSVEKQVCLLEEENKLLRKEFDAQLDEAMNAHVEIFILQKLIQDLEGKNLSLLNECQKYLEASQISDKLISELEAENFEQNMETEFLLDENEKLKKGISQMFKALKIDIDTCSEDKIELEHACLPLFLECVEKMKKSASENEDKIQQLEVLEAEKGNLLLKFENMQKSYLNLEDRNTRALQENRFLLKKKLELKKRNCMVEDENEIILHENLTYNTLSLIFQNLGIEKGSELKTMRTIVKTLEKECENSKLMGDHQVNQVLELSRKNNNLTNEVKYLHEVNGKLESELNELHEEIKERRLREENLSSELEDKSNEFEIWEAEAASFYFDLQFSSTREVLLESKVHELTGVCESLEQESVSKSMEIGHMKEKLSLLENEVGGLNEQLSAYVPLMVSLEDDIASFEHNALSRTKSDFTGIFESEDMNIDGEICENNCQEVPENKATVNPNGISDLQMMRRKIKAIEKAVMEHMERLAQEKILQITIKPKASMKEIESPKSNNNSTEKNLPQENIDETEISEAQNGTLMKDIPLDQVSDCAVSVIIRRRNVETDKQMLELWQTAEQNCTSTAIIKELINQEPSSTENDYMYNQFKNMNQINKDYPSSELEVEKVLGIDKLESPSIRERTKEGHKRRVLEKLASDAQKLMSIQVLVQDLRKKTDLTSKKGKDINKQLQEVKEYVVQLMDINGQMTKNIASPSFSESKEAGILHRMRVLEQARKGSEKIEKVELEVQKLQLKLEDGNKSKAIKRFSKNTTSIAFRNFIHIGRRSGRKHKKACLCGCLRPSPTEAEVLLGKMA